MNYFKKMLSVLCVLALCASLMLPVAGVGCGILAAVLKMVRARE